MYGRSQKSTTEKRVDALTQLRDQLTVAAKRGIGREIAVPAPLEDEFELRRIAAVRRRERMEERLAGSERNAKAQLAASVAALVPTKRPPTSNAAAGRKGRAPTRNTQDREIMQLVNRQLEKRKDPRFVAAFMGGGRR